MSYENFDGCFLEELLSEKCSIHRFVSTMSEQGAAEDSTRAYGWRAIVICDVRGNLLGW